MNPGVGLFVQVVLTAKQAELLTLAADKASVDATKAGRQDLADEYAGLRSFFSFVATNPRAFPVRGRMATSIKTRLRHAKKGL